MAETMKLPMKEWVPRLKAITTQDMGEMKLGNALFHQGNFLEAIDAFQAALKVNPDLAGAHFMLGEVYHKQKLFSEAIDHYQQTLRLKPEQPWVSFKLGATYRALGANAEAAEAFRAASNLRSQREGESPGRRDSPQGLGAVPDWTTDGGDPTLIELE
jgi:tetratricopeptide (TPR) repeat protein